MNSDKNSTVLIVGCGWVGKKLGEKLINDGFTVYGTTRSSSNFSELNEIGIKPVKLNLPAVPTSEIHLPEVVSVLISISPGRGENRSEYPTVIGQLSRVLAQRNVQVLMYSSTSAYGNATDEVIETDTSPDPNSDNAIVAAEGELLEHIPEAVILRLCGLYGEDRHPAKYMAGRTDIADGDAPVNLVHRDDVIQVTQKTISENIRGEIFNVCSGSHPSRSEIYTVIAERMGLKKPTFLEGGADGKTVSSKKLKDRFDFDFMHPNPLEFLNS
ncbi:NAD-dependent epimerase/dehydratase family protein [Gracilimonas sp.]|uniref:NAD-dependent epimerase/dehydratase family protein n=1 Tax=Gracilimonas sp. TaxID=1974203 RepID=UPI003BAB2C32